MQARPAGFPPLPFIAVVVHLVLCYSVIDIHFQSPVITGVPPVWPPSNAPAKRLALVVADGLRPDYLVRDRPDGTPLAPFLRHRGVCTGAFGVSHTRPPTESRPGHVALTAGFYEDPSALFSGWKANPVPFGSIFTHARAAWGLGSPDVVPIWAGHGQYHWQAYDADMEDWSTNTDLFELDTWVFNRTDEILADSAARSALRSGPSLLFLHLLGLDSQSHAHGGPHSQQYLDNVALVDSSMAWLEARMEAAFPDAATTYLLTSDHGMTDQASHGDASPECTQTPYVLWGAGIAPAGAPFQACSACEAQCFSSSSPEGISAAADPQEGSNRRTDFASSVEAVSASRGVCLGTCGAHRELTWGLTSPQRVDVHQAQLAPLMSALLGLPAPTNGLFMLPHQLLNRGKGSMKFAAQALYADVKSLLAAHDRLAQDVQQSAVHFQEHAGLANSRVHLATRVSQATLSGDYGTALHAAAELGEAVESALLYLQRYHWKLLYAVVVATYLLWEAALAVQLLCTHAAADNSRAAVVMRSAWAVHGRFAAAVAGLLAIVWGLLMQLQCPVSYYMYGTLLSVLAAHSVRRRAVLGTAASVLMRSPPGLRHASLIIAALVAMSAGFHARFVFCAICCVLGVITACSVPPPFRIDGVINGCLLAVTGAFTCLPVHKTPALVLILAPSGALLAMLAALATTAAHPRAVPALPTHSPRGLWAKLQHAFRACPKVLWLQGGMLLLTAAVIAVTQPPPSKPCHAFAGDGNTSIAASTARFSLCTADRALADLMAPMRDWATAPLGPEGPLALSSAAQLVLQGLALAAPIIPLLSPSHLLPRLLSSVLGLFVPFAILSVSWEALFLLCFCATALGYCSLAMDLAEFEPGGAEVPRATPPSVETGAVLASAGNTGLVDECSAAIHWLHAIAQCSPRQGRVHERDERMCTGPALAAAKLKAEAWEAMGLILGINLAFFGTGNMASVASFEPASVLRLITRFDKLKMGALLMAKIVLPLLTCTVIFFGYARWRGRSVQRLCIMLLLLSNIMAIVFFFQVTSEGSWQVIGTSLSHFGVMNIEVVIVLLLSLVAAVYVGRVRPRVVQKLI